MATYICWHCGKQHDEGGRNPCEDRSQVKTQKEMWIEMCVGAATYKAVVHDYRISENGSLETETGVIPVGKWREIDK